MKKILAMVFMMLFGFAVLNATGCSDPCEKFYDQWVKCSKIPKSVAKKNRKKAIKECKKDKDLKKFAKKCASISDCKKFKKCRRGEK